MAEIIIEDIERRTKLTLAGTVSRGNLVGYSSGWKAADADAATYIYAEYIALDAGVSGDEIDACKGATFYDGDAPYNADKPQYVSGTAGALTETRPATDGDLIQVVGRSIDTYRARIDIQPPKEFELYITPDTYDETGEPGLGTVDAAWVGPQINNAEEDVYFKGRIPSGLVGTTPDVARVIYNSINASAFDMDVHIVAAYDGAANNEDTGTSITAGDWNEDADNKLLYQDVSACFDSGMYKPGRNFCLNLDPDAITNDANVIALYIRGWKV